jgi:hypothetical protein
MAERRLRYTGLTEQKFEIIISGLKDKYCGDNVRMPRFCDVTVNAEGKAGKGGVPAYSASLTVPWEVMDRVEWDNSRIEKGVVQLLLRYVKRELDKPQAERKLGPEVEWKSIGSVQEREAVIQGKPGKPSEDLAARLKRRKFMRFRILSEILSKRGVAGLSENDIPESDAIWDDADEIRRELEWLRKGGYVVGFTVTEEGEAYFEDLTGSRPWLPEGGKGPIGFSC